MWRMGRVKGVDSSCESAVDFREVEEREELNSP